jgi:hypothetical protein
VLHPRVHVGARRQQHRAHLLVSLETAGDIERRVAGVAPRARVGVGASGEQRAHRLHLAKLCGQVQGRKAIRGVGVDEVRIRPQSGVERRQIAEGGRLEDR